MSKTLHILLWLLLPAAATAQITTLRSKTLPLQSLPQQLDSLTIAPESVEVIHPITRAKLSSTAYQLSNNFIRFDTALVFPPATHLLIRYRVLPFNLGKPLSRIDTSLLSRNAADRLIGVPYNPYESLPTPLLPERGMDYSGNYTRGISFGNNQNLVLNSQFNMQMAGNLGDLEVLAAITDNNIPLQPEGNTQQLREFDRIFIQVAKNQNKLIAGDYELVRPNAYFMNYFKKLQGATFSRQWTLPGASRQQGSTTAGAPKLDTKASVAIARGKFARNTLSAQEGNQGPYRLEGAEGERFIIVLAGTEKVFLDGQLMVRGLDADYVIDYNAGHITFTNRRLITKDRRIVVEFDYNVQNYTRSLYALNNEIRTGKYRLYLHTYSEQDGRQPVDEDFTPAQSEALRNAGDNPNGAISSSIDTVLEYSAFRVLYELRDTTVNGIVYTGILVFSTDSQRARYTAGFSQVGPGNGNYLLDPTVPANGRVYRWVAPDPVTGQPQGQFEPVRRLIAPNSQQLYTAGGEASLSANTKVRAEVALSQVDKNKFSSLDDDDNAGLAATAGLHQVFEFSKKDKKAVQSSSYPSGSPAPALRWRLETQLDYEFTQQNFRELNPYRPAEFTRDWNLNRGVNDVAITVRQTQEHLLHAGVSLRTPGYGNLEYRLGGFFRDSLYSGLKHFAKYTFQKNGYDLSLQSDWLYTSGTLENSSFQRPKVNFSVPFLRDSTGTKFWRAGFYGEREKNARYSGLFLSDTLNAASFYYDLLRLYVESAASEKVSFNTNFQRRYDYAPRPEGFSPSTQADELNLNGSWQQSKTSRLSWNFTWRELSIRDTSLSNLNPSTTYLGRMDYALNLFKGAIQSSSSYEIGSGQERKVEFVYLQVPAGEGTHQWIDRNGDGKVQFDEVEPAPFPDVANAVRVTVFTEEFIQTNNVTFNQGLRIEPRAVWFNAGGIRKLASKFSTQSSLQINRKVRQLEDVSAWNPFQLDIADTALVAIRSTMYNTLFFNRSDPRYDLQYTQSVNRSKQAQTNGFESRNVSEQSLKFRWNLAATLSLTSSFSLGIDEQDSEQFENRRYRIQSFESRPQLTLQPSASFRTALGWRYQYAENRLGTGGENACTNDIKWEMTFNQSTTTSLRTELSFVKINFTGQANSPVGFAFLQGLQNGRNYIWNIGLDRQLAKNIRAGISYEGRRTGEAKMVHIGRAQVGAVF
ncbi:MAG: hypothetical protein RI973_1672 [Bacteroidota bacterium]|jgi:hypothetical protein